MTLLLWFRLAMAVTPQEVVDLELARAPVAEFEAALADPSAAVRARAVRAVGRLRSADALAALHVARTDSDPAVRAAAAASLAWTPSSAPEIRDWLGSLPPLVPGLAAVGRDDLRPVLLRALGDQGDASDVPTLVAALGCSSRLSVAAADALADLARRDVAEAADAVPALISTLGRLDATLVEAVAHALFRIKPEARWSPVLAASIPRLPSGPARVWVLRAAAPGLPSSARTPLLLDSLTDSDGRVVAVAWELLGGLESPPGGLDKLPVPDDRQAAYSRSLALSEPAEPPANPVEVALSAETAPERTAAVTALMAATPPANVALELLKASDASVREGGVALLEDHTDSAQVTAALLEHLPTEGDVHVVLAILQHLTNTRESGTPDAAALKPLIEPLGVHESPGVRAAVRALASTAKLDVVVANAPHPTVDLKEAATIRTATLHTTRGPIRVALRPDVAPLTVSRFAAHAEADFYDNTVLHRLVPSFVVQGGDPRGDGWGSPAESLVDEVSAVRFEAGAFGLARGDRDTGGAQFFISLGPTPHLTGDYTWFGEVVQGFGVARSLTPEDRVLDVIIERSTP